MAARRATRRRHGIQGFTLVELMVGLLLGLLTVLAITQVLALSESRQRTTAAGSDAQVNGALAVFTLQRELQMAGYGIVSKPESLGCPLAGTLTLAGPPSATEAFAGTLAPVTITAGANGLADTLTILQARKAGYAVPVVVNAAETNYYSVLSSLGVSPGDLMVAVPAAWSAAAPCRLFSVTNTESPPSDLALSAQRVPHVVLNGTSWNEGNANTLLAANPAAFLVNLGTLGFSAYTVNNLALQLTTRTNTTGSSSSQLFPHVVNLQALYGKDTDSNGVVDTYDKTTPTTNAGWRQVLSVRLAVVSRSIQYEKDEVTLSAPLWDLGASATAAGVADCGASKCLSIKIDHVPDWKHYRYRIYDTTVPLRNMLWNAAS